MISNEWYTTNHRHVAAYATLTVKATVDKKPFTFNWPWNLKSTDILFLNSRDNFMFLRTPGQSIKISNCPRQTERYGMYVFGLGQIDQSQ